MLALVAMVTGHAVVHVFLSGSLLVLPEIKAALGLSNTGVGVIAATRDVFSGLISFPAGFVADRFARRLAAILGLSVVGLGVCMFFVGISTTFWMALVSITFLDMVIVFWHPPALAILSARYPERRGFAIGMHGTGGSIGEAIGPALLGFLLGFLLWRTVLQMSVIPAVLMGIGVYLLVRAAPSVSASTATLRYFSGVKEMVGNARLLLVLATAVCFSGTQIALTNFMPIYLREDLQLSTAATGAVLSMLQIAGIGSQPVLGYLSDRLGRRPVLAFGFAGLTLGTLALYVAGDGPAFFAATALTGLFMFPMMAIVLALGMDEVGASVQGTTASIIFGVGTILSAISAWLAGRIADVYGVDAVFLYAAAPAFLSLFFTVIGSSLRPRRPG